MFEDLEKKDPNKGTQPNPGQPEDIFAETDNLNSGSRPNLPPSLSSDQVDRMGSSQKKFSAEKYRPYRAPVPKGAKLLRKIIVTVVVLAVIIFGAYYVYSTMFSVPAEPVVNNTPANNVVTEEPDPVVIPEPITEPEEEIMPIDQIIEEEVSTTTPEVVEEQTKPDFLVIDLDEDGLNGEEEIELGTNINKADTDDDGLTDWQEAKIHGTDPLQPDTDGDGYLDGAEVDNGYNPLGEGKL